MTTKHHAAQYNLVAKKLRERFPTELTTSGLIERAVIANIALDFAKSFAADNELFDPLKFLDACSPDVDMYPLSELWEEHANTR